VKVGEALPKVLCVDDEPNVLDGLKRQLRRKFEVETATSGAEALTLLTSRGPFTAVVSDMRMPQMDGSQFLSAARTVAPDTVRLLLTGYADIEAAIRAVNEGSIFRFLSKPCPAELLSSALDAAVEQHRLRLAEKELLERTLRGSIDALGEVLSLASPLAFGRARRIQRTAVELAQSIGITEVWQIEVATILSQLGAVTLPHETLERWEQGQTLSAEEQEMIARFPALADKMLGHIPRIEAVREIISAATRPIAQEREGRTPLAARVLRLAIDFDALVTAGTTPVDAASLLESRGSYEAKAVAALRGLVGASQQGQKLREIPIGLLTTGMILDQDLRTHQGTLLVARGHVVGESLLLRLRNLGARQQLPDTVRVISGR
jgi:response regulator RpfG family c-di-GMP phosphodiesterase